MSDIVRIALDGMGGDNAPASNVAGAIEAIQNKKNIKIYLVGQRQALEAELSKYEQYPKEQIEIVQAEEIIHTHESPVEAIRRKKDSSLVVAARLVKEQKADAFCSAGSTGAILVGGQVLIGKAKNIKRTPLAPLIPTLKGESLLIDCGANVDARADHLVQFAKLGSLYMQTMLGIKKPKVALLNIGVEEEKGNALTKEVFPLLKECSDIHFVGNIEARDIPLGEVDVIVSEAFAGNIALKTYEGVGKALLTKIKGGLLSSLRGKIGGLLIKPIMKKTLKNFDASEHGGAPMLGLKGLVVKMHGNATSKEVKNTIFQCAAFIESGMLEKIEKII